MIFMGIAIWWTPDAFVLKLAGSTLLIGSGVAFGAITVEFLKDEYY
jgi:hypothetical protein